MDFSKMSYVLLPDEDFSDKRATPENFLTAAGAALAIRAGALGYQIGKDLIPKLKGTSPLAVQVVNSSPSVSGDHYHLDLILSNAGANSICVEGVEIRQGASEIGRGPGIARPMGWAKPTRGSQEEENELAKTLGEVLPELIYPSESCDLRVRCRSDIFYNGSVPMEFGTFLIKFSDLSGTKTEESKDANFRILNLPRKETGGGNPL